MTTDSDELLADTATPTRNLQSSPVIQIARSRSAPPRLTIPSPKVADAASSARADRGRLPSPKELPSRDLANRKEAGRVKAVIPRALNSQESMRYLGLRRRTWNELKRRLKPVRLGTSTLFDRRDLDKLFDEFKQGYRDQIAEDSYEHNEADSSLRSKVIRSAMDGRPSKSEKGGSKWAVNKASTTTHATGNGESTKSFEVNAFRVVTTRIRKRSNGC